MFRAGWVWWVVVVVGPSALHTAVCGVGSAAVAAAAMLLLQRAPTECKAVEC